MTTFTPRRKHGFTMQVLVSLKCGCRVRTRNYPLNEQARMGCSSGLGHSYNQPWLSWTDTERGTSSINRSQAIEETA
mgnify:CR=1 FL=1